jgi:hypothetical protein
LKLAALRHCALAVHNKAMEVLEVRVWKPASAPALVAIVCGSESPSERRSVAPDGERSPLRSWRARGLQRPPYSAAVEHRADPQSVRSDALDYVLCAARDVLFAFGIGGKKERWRSRLAPCYVYDDAAEAAETLARVVTFQTRAHKQETRRVCLVIDDCEGSGAIVLERDARGVRTTTAPSVGDMVSLAARNCGNVMALLTVARASSIPAEAREGDVAVVVLRDATADARREAWASYFSDALALDAFDAVLDAMPLDGGVVIDTRDRSTAFAFVPTPQLPFGALVGSPTFHELHRHYTVAARARGNCFGCVERELGLPDAETATRAEARARDPCPDCFAEDFINWASSARRAKLK